MITSKYRWDMPVIEEKFVTELADSLNISPLVAGVLTARGWKSDELTAAFLQSDVEQLLDPYEMKGMRAAVDCITQAIAAGDKIRVYGDYDADGVTSTSLMIRLLTELGATFDTYIPHRSKEGYGLNLGAIDLAIEAGIRLLITVDNGISAVEQIAYAAERGIKVVVTDHHEPPEVLPEAVALVNPKQKDCSYPFKGLCGAGVVFKLAHALLGRPVLEYADLAAIGTIADLMPLVGENRVIARLGLEQMRRQPVAGIRALSKVSGFKPEDLTSGRIGFSLAPRLNAGGRLEHADRAVKLLEAATDEEADLLAMELDVLNGERQTLVERTVIEADEIWQHLSSAATNPRNVILLANEGWNAGIAGLVASKLVERYYRPVIILAIDPETGFAKGSARSIDGFDLYAALTECAELMEHYGGHKAAAGMTISREKVGELADQLHVLAEQWLNEEDWQPKRRVDLKINLRDVTLEAVEQLAQLEPFGNGNPTPRVVIPNVLVRESRTMGKDKKHLRITVEQAGQTIEAVAFGMGEQRDRLAPDTRIDLLGELSVNEWNGTRRVQIMLQDYRSDELRLLDRRKEQNMWSSVENLVLNPTSEIVIGCATATLYTEAVARFGHTPISICLYNDSFISHRTEVESAAAKDLQSSVMKSWRQLILLGLPSDEQELITLKQWLAPERGGESVHIYSEPGFFNKKQGENSAGFPDRKHFAQIYAMCRKQGEWLDAPDGFIQKAGLATGWPLSTIRMMQEVFIELGFIAAEGAKRKIVSEPPRRELEQSIRYGKAKEQFDGACLHEMTTEQLREWFAAHHR
ncbi:single-stranded-DNA-specific exonuclease RecJ [Cohnella sp.]|uniref:single-stranded-DNA-specific exonuclease RecJ n=1 Tax=Cohnella sp. TaxID=1883426 RepID=UPI003563B8B7